MALCVRCLNYLLLRSWKVSDCGRSTRRAKLGGPMCSRGYLFDRNVVTDSKKISVKQSFRCFLKISEGTHHKPQKGRVQKAILH